MFFIAVISLAIICLVWKCLKQTFVMEKSCVHQNLNTYVYLVTIRLQLKTSKIRNRQYSRSGESRSFLIKNDGNSTRFFLLPSARVVAKAKWTIYEKLNAFIIIFYTVILQVSKCCKKAPFFTCLTARLPAVIFVSNIFHKNFFCFLINNRPQMNINHHSFSIFSIFYPFLMH